MDPWRRALILTCSAALPALIGCAPRGAGPAPVAAQTSSPTPCEHLPVSRADVDGLLASSVIDTTLVPGDTQSCEYTTGGFPSVIVSVRPGVGQRTVDDWTQGRMALKVVPLAGVGDGAVWQPALREVIAYKKSLLCDIQVRAGDGDLAPGNNEIEKSMGALCNKIFASY
jgi:hypothetical protein